MLYTGAVDTLAAVSLKKATSMKHSLTGFLTLSVLAGFYIGFGVILAFVCAAPVAAINPGIGKIVAGATFGIALSLVIIGGAELFTGYNLLIFQGTLRGTVTFGDAMLGWFWTYVGNLGRVDDFCAYDYCIWYLCPGSMESIHTQGSYV